MRPLSLSVSRRARLGLVVGVATAAVVAMVLLPPLKQPQAYHQFADQRTALGVSHFQDVASNLPFLVAGLMGLACASGRIKPGFQFIEPRERGWYVAFFGAILLTAFGSAYYHVRPDNGTLVWDRLPMAIAFTALLAATFGERVSVQAGTRLLLPLLLAGIGSVAYWRWSELRGQENLLPYVTVQYLSLLVILLLVALFPPRYTRQADWYWIVAFYGAAKVAEVLDRPIYAFTERISGHTLKHLLAGLAVYWVWRMLRKRTRVDQPTGSSLVPSTGR